MPPSSTFICNSIKKNGSGKISKMYYHITLLNLRNLVEMLNVIKFEGGECETESPRINLIIKFRESISALLGDALEMKEVNVLVTSNSVEDVLDNIIKPKINELCCQMASKSVKGLVFLFFFLFQN